MAEVEGNGGPTVICRPEGAALVVTLNRPHVRNAVDGGVAEGMNAAMRRLDDDADVRAAILTGAGGTFCSGMDLAAFSSGTFEPASSPVTWVEQPPRKPVIAAVEGHAVAGGWELALACDLVVASSAALFSLAEVRRGLVPLGGGALRLPKRMPYHVAMELLLTGNRIDGERAAHFGAVNRLTEPGGALDGALELADEIAACGPLAVSAILQIARRTGDWPEASGWDRQRELGLPVFDSEDALEGARAFVEKRPPAWRGQ